MQKVSKSLFTIYLLGLFVLVGCAAGGDDLGLDESSIDNGVIVPDLPIETPTGVSLIFPASSPGFAVNPRVRVNGVSVGHTAQIYTNQSCSGSPVGTAVVASGSSVDVTISPDITVAGPYQFYARMVSGALVSRCTGDFNIFASYILDPSLGPTVTGLANDSTPTNNKVWTWGCDKASCNYRFAVNTNPTHSFTTEPYNATNTTSVSGVNGTYYVHIQARDNGTSIEGVVQSYSAILDSVNPTLTAVSVTSNNANANFARVGDTLTLTFTASEVLGAVPSVTINGSVAPVADLGSQNYSATYTYSAADLNGLASFTIDFADVAGNAGTQVNATTDLSSVVFDKTAPSLSPVSIASNNANPAFAILGNTVSLTFSSDETLGSLPIVSVNGSAKSVTDLGSNNFRVDHVITGADPLGVVTFSIDYADQAGNNGAQVTATTDASSVTVDNSVPTLSPVSISSNNANTSLARVGDVVTVSFTASETLGGLPVVTINGNAAVEANTGGNNYTATYTMQASDTEGLITFTIDFSDLAGNAGSQVTSVTDGSSVTFDKTIPTLTPVTISSSNANSSFARVGDTVTLSFTASETLKGTPSATLNGVGRTVIPVGGNAYLVSYTLTAGDIEGVMTFTIDFADPAGNNGTQVTTTTNASSVTFDRTVPTLSPVSIASNNANTALAVIGDTVSLTFTASENLGALPTVTINGNARTATDLGSNNYQVDHVITGADPQAAVTFTVDFADQAGNAGVQVTATTDASTVTVDGAIPTLNPVSITSNNADNSFARVGDVVTISFTGSEDLQNVSATIAGQVAAIAGGPTVWTATYTMTAGEAEGVVPFAIDFEDLSGNSGTQVSSVTDGSSVTFDRSIPTLSTVSIASNNANTALARVGDVVTVSFTSNEALNALPVVTINGNAAVEANPSGNNFTATYTMQGTDSEGLVSFTVDFADAAGNAGTQVTAVTDGSSVTFDRTVPTLSPVSIASNNANTALAVIGDTVSLTFTASETLGALPTVTINGNARTATDLGSNNYQVDHVITGADPQAAVTFTVDFADQADNAGVQVTATTDASTVTVDGSIPTLSPVSIASNNANTSLARVGDVVTVSFTGSENLQNVSATIAGQVAAIAGGPTVWTATYTMTAGESEGVVPFAIDFEDLSGNSGTQVTAVTDGSSVTFDRSIPTLSTVSIASNNANTALARVGDVVTVSFTSNEALNALPVVTINGNAAVEANPSGNNFTATYTMQGTDSEGLVSFTIDFADAAGNAGTQVTAVTDGSSVTFDRTLPTLSPVSIASNNADSSLAVVGDVVTVSFTSNEALNALPVVTINGNAAVEANPSGNNFTATYTMQGTDSDGLVSFTIDFADAAGNAGTQVTAVTDGSSVTFDRTAPTLSPVSIVSNNANTALARVGDVVTLSFTGSENLQNVSATIAGQVAAIAGGPTVWTATYTMTAGEAEGVVPFTIDFEDAFGNPGTQVSSVTDGSSVTFDRTVPTLSPVSIASNNASTALARVGDVVTVSFTSNEALNALPVVTINGNAAVEANPSGNNFTATYTMQGTDSDGLVSFTIDFADAAGNVGTQVTTVTDGSSVTFDQTAPTLSPVSIASNNADTSLARVGDIVTLSFTGNESLQNVSATIAGQVAAIAGGPTVWTATYTMTAGEAEGVIPFTIDFEDAFGNPGTQVTAVTDGSSVTFDRTVPTLSPVSIASNNADSSLAVVGDVVTVSFTSNEALNALPVVTINGNAAVEANPSGNNFTATYTMQASDTEGLVSFTIDFADAAGNAGTQVTAVTDGSSVTFDQTAPTLSPVSIASNNVDTSLAKVGDVVTVSFTGSENLQNVSATIAGQAAAIAGGPTVWTATYTMTAGEAEGVVPFTIDFEDLTGNSGTQVSSVTDGSSVTFDRTAPTLSPVSIASNNANTALARVGDVVTVSFTSNEALNALPVVTINGNAAVEANPSGNNFTATYTMQGTDSEGLMSFTIDFADAAGNGGTQVTAVTDGSSVTFDRTIPTLSPVSIASNNADTSRAVVGDVVTVSFTSNEALNALPVVTINGNAAVEANPSGNNFTATYTMQASDTEGLVSFTIDFADAAGNAGTQVTAVTDGSSVTFDRTAPTLSPVSIASNNADTSLARVGDVVTLSFTSSEALGAMPVVTIAGNAAVEANPSGNNYTATYTMQASDSDGVVSFTIDFVDSFGNAGTQVTTVTDASSVTFDKTAPTLSPVSIASNNANTAIAVNGDIVTLTFTSNEPLIGLPVATIHGGGATVTDLGSNNYSATYNVTGATPDGVIPFTIDFTDASGNVGVQVTATTDASSVTVDTPSVVTNMTVSANGTYNLATDISFTVTFDEAVTVVGAPRIQLTVGAATRYADFASGSGGTSLVFTYDTQSGDEDTDGIAFGSTTIDLNSGTIRNGSGTDASLDFSGFAPNLTGVLVDALIPTVVITSSPNINLSNETSYVVSGSCSENGRIINLNIGSIALTPTCSGGSWTSGVQNVSGEADGIVNITADHDDAAGNTATQADVDVNKDTATVVVAITSAPNISAINETDYVVSGTCSNNGSIVDVNIGSINIQPNCSGGTWTTGNRNVSSLADGAVTITADHLTATQASVGVTKDTAAATVSISFAPNINSLNETSYSVSGECSENGTAVSVDIAGLGFTPNCTSGTWTTGNVDVSSRADGSILITADHSTATQASTTVTKNTASPSVVGLSVATTLSTSAELSWSLDNPSASTINDYEFNFRVQGTTTWLTFDDGISVLTSTNITGLVASTTYEFRARVRFDGSSLSDWSNTATGTTQPDSPLFNSQYAAMNLGGATTTNVVALEDGTTVTRNGTAINGGVPLNKGQVVNITSAQFDIIDADKPIYTSGRRGAGGNTAKANVTWNPTDWAGKSFSFNAIRGQTQKLYIYPAEDTTVEVYQGNTLLASATFTADNTTPTSGTNPLSWTTYGSYQVISTGTVLTYHISENTAGTRLEDPKPLPPAHTEIIGFPSNSMRLTTNFDGTNYSFIHSNSTANSGSINKTAVVNIGPQATTASSLYRSHSLLINTDQATSGASFADSNGNCAAPFLPTNLMRTRYAINNSADYVAFASKQAGTIQVLDGSDNVVETLTFQRTGANANAPYYARTQTATGTTSGRRFVSTVPMAAWYQPDNDTGTADQDETILYGVD